MRILNIAEKPSVARSISYSLSNTVSKRKGRHKYTAIYEFKYNNDIMTFTSVLGHVYNYDFIKNYNNTDINDNNIINDYKNIYSLFDTPIEKKVIEPKIIENIISNIKNIDKILLWTDCDREGENIAQEIYDTIINSHDRTNRINRQNIKRIRFNAIEKNHLINAITNETNININEALAVDARMELDLRIGIIMSRLQTQYFKSIKTDRLPINDDNKMITYGPCQIPTLNFVVEREDSIKNFIEETFYSLEVKIKKKKENIFLWNRNKIYDKKCINYIYNWLVGDYSIIYNNMANKNNVSSYNTLRNRPDNIATVINVNTSTEKKLRPLPLRTVELQKICTRLFNISSYDLMNICEKLYINGYISYPRTETDCFKNNFNFKSIVDKIKVDKELCGSVSKLNNIMSRNDSDIKYYPRKGRNDDNAHSPIYPLKHGDSLSALERKIYLYISHRFLASISKDAIIKKEKVEVKIMDEIFICTGTKVVEYNYLEIYKYDKVMEKEIDNFVIGEHFSYNGHKDSNNNGAIKNSINNYDMRITDSKTKPPEYLTEPELISLMDRYGIGTDSTIHEHINKIIIRKYSIKRSNKIEPLPLGRILIHGYNRMLDNKGYNTADILDKYCLNKPTLRSNLESKLKEVEKGEILKNRVVEEDIEIYKRIFKIVTENLHKFKEEALDNNNYKGKDYKSNNNKDIFIKSINNNTDNRNISNRGNNNKIINDNNKTPYIGTNIDKNVKCDCKKETKLSIVTKDTENKGKYFYSCNQYPNGCNFFQWQDNKDILNNNYKENKDIKSRIDQLNTFINKRSKNTYNDRNTINHNYNDISSDDIKCNCGYTPKILVSKTEKNKNREFYKCNREYKPCNYFQWR